MTEEGTAASNTALLMTLDEEIDKRIAAAMIRIFDGTAFNDKGFQLGTDVIRALSESPVLGTLMHNPVVQAEVKNIIRTAITIS